MRYARDGSTVKRKATVYLSVNTASGKRYTKLVIALLYALITLKSKVYRKDQSTKMDPLACPLQPCTPTSDRDRVQLRLMRVACTPRARCPLSFR